MRTRERTRLCRFEAADVLLVHTKHSLWGWLIRLGTRSYWNHALMVCRTGDGDGYRGTLVVDAKSNGSVVIGPIAMYLDRPGKFDVAVKRLETDLPEEDSLRLRSHICDVAVNEVDVKVGLPIVGALDRLARQVTLIARFIGHKLGRGQRLPALGWSARPSDMKAFTCGGFVQWCYYQAARRTVAGNGDERLLESVLFNPRAGTGPTPFELLTTTPADLAGSTRLGWRYVIRDGVVEESAGAECSTLCAAAA